MPDPGLVDAVNVALMLGQPLLLTGEPGTGKTQLAYSVAWELGLGDPLMFATKSTSAAKDLFYIYDTLGRFHAAQTKEGSQYGLDYITYSALGAAILLANRRETVARWLPVKMDHDGPRRSVVLIDEIDKAPRDFPNDLLNEVEGMFFRIPELGNPVIKADETLSPVVIVTSNSEKHLPDAFLRRCAYYNIPFPDRTRLAGIVGARLGLIRGSIGRGLADALDLFDVLRQPNNGLIKRPATAELLGWLSALRRLDVDFDQPLRPRPEVIRQTLSALIKSGDDQEKAAGIVAQWQATGA
jgi:MoxR-like ATPase